MLIRSLTTNSSKVEAELPCGNGASRFAT